MRARFLTALLITPTRLIMIRGQEPNAVLGCTSVGITALYRRFKIASLAFPQTCALLQILEDEPDVPVPDQYSVLIDSVKNKFKALHVFRG